MRYQIVKEEWNMKKQNSFLPILLTYMVILFLYSVFVFSVFSSAYSPVFWIGYIATFISYVISFSLSYIVFVKNISPTNRFLGLPLHHVGILYASLQTIFSLIFMAIPAIPFLVSVLIQIFLFGISTITLVSTQGARNYIEHMDDSVKEKRMFIIETANQIHLLETKAEEKSIQNSLHKVYETIRYSDPMSSEKLEHVETQMKTTLQELQTAALSHQVDTIEKKCQELCILAEQRNMLCQQYKQ